MMKRISIQMRKPTRTTRKSKLLKRLKEEGLFSHNKIIRIL
jgi:hypothetical protein